MYAETVLPLQALPTYNMPFGPTAKKYEVSSDWVGSLSSYETMIYCHYMMHTIYILYVHIHIHIHMANVSEQVCTKNNVCVILENDKHRHANWKS